MLYQTAAQSVATDTPLTLATSTINSTGDITLSGTNGVTLAPGQYLVTFAADAAVTGDGNIGASLALDGTALAYATASQAQTAASGAERIALTAIIAPTASQTLTVRNATGNTVSYTDSTLTVVKLA